MFSRLFNLGFKSSTLKNGSRILGYSATSTSNILDPGSPALAPIGSGVGFDQENIFQEEEDNTNDDSGAGNTPHLKYAVIAAILALGSKMDEYGHCLFSFGVGGSEPNNQFSEPKQKRTNPINGYFRRSTRPTIRSRTGRP